MFKKIIAKLTSSWGSMRHREWQKDREQMSRTIERLNEERVREMEHMRQVSDPSKLEKVRGLESHDKAA